MDPAETCDACQEKENLAINMTTLECSHRIYRRLRI
jgi:hypothetical protein